MICGLNTYCTDGPDVSATSPVIVIIPDAFGSTFVNSKLLADSFASAGYRVYLPDFMDGNPCSSAAMDSMYIALSPKTGLLDKAGAYARAARHFGPFMFSNRNALALPRIETFFNHLRVEVGPDIKIGTAGYCWGGQHVFKLAGGLGAPTGQKPLVQCMFTAHPSNFSIPVDVENVKIPVSVAIGDKDFALAPKAQKQVMAIMDKSGIDHEFRVYPGATHGFAVRGNPNVPEEEEYQRQARDQAVAWFDKYLK